MNEEQKMQVAVFRFGVIADIVTGAPMPRAEKRRLLKEKCAASGSFPSRTAPTSE